jgi:hypothetical protein
LKFEVKIEAKKSIRFDLEVQIPDKQMRFYSKGVIFIQVVILENNIPLHFKKALGAEIT